MFNADFVWVNFDETLQPGEETTRSFTIDADPEPAADGRIDAEGFIIVQARDVGRDNVTGDDGNAVRHEIRINGNSLPAFDMVAHEGWNLWMDRIPVGFLQRGQNRLTVARIGNDRFHVANVVVQWREAKARSGAVTAPVATQAVR